MKDDILLGRKLTYEQIKNLPDGTKVYIKELNEEKWKSICIKSRVSIKEGNYLKDTNNKNNHYVITEDMEYSDNMLDVEFYEMCELSESVELTTAEELLSLPDGTYVFVYESKDSELDSCLCIKQINMVNELYKDEGYIIEDLEIYQWRGVKFYVDKTVKLQNQVEEYPLSVKIVDKEVTIEFNGTKYIQSMETDSEADKLITIGTLLKTLSEDVIKLGENKKFKTFETKDWVRFLNGEIALKCSSEEYADELVDLLKKMSYGISMSYCYDENVQHTVCEILEGEVCFFSTRNITKEILLYK